MDGEVGTAERVIAGLADALEGAKGSHQFLWSIRLMVARAQTALLAGRHDDAISFAHAALAEAERFGRGKYGCLARIPLGRALLVTGRAQEAADALTRAVLEAERLGHLPSHWPALAALAEAKVALGDEAAAADARAAAVRSVEEFGGRLTDAHRASLMKRPDVIELMS